MEEFLRYVIAALVEHPEDLVLSKTETPQRIDFRVAACRSDVPRIIGKSGHTIQALRTLLVAASQKQGRDVSLEVVE